MNDIDNYIYQLTEDQVIKLYKMTGLQPINATICIEHATCTIGESSCKVIKADQVAQLNINTNI